MRIGVVGLGFMGSTHLEAYQKVAGFELAAVASSDPQKLSGDLSAVGGNLDRGGGNYDFSAAARYAAAGELIADPDVEAVDLCTPTHLHAPLALQALAAGKHVLVEKPMALTAGDCGAMIAAAKKAGRVLMVAQVLRFFRNTRRRASWRCPASWGRYGRRNFGGNAPLRRGAAGSRTPRAAAAARWIC